MTAPAAHKVAVWQATAPPAHLSLAGVMAATGLDLVQVSEVLADGCAAGLIVIHDEDRKDMWIERVEVAE